MKHIYLFYLLICTSLVYGQATARIEIFTLAADSSLQMLTKNERASVEIFDQTTAEFYYFDAKKTYFEWRGQQGKAYNLTFMRKGFSTQSLNFVLQLDTTIQLIIKPLSDVLCQYLATVEVESKQENSFLGIVSGMGLYASKKSDVIDLAQVQGNLAANNPRAIYAKVAGLSVWENDNSGLQLNIAVRGMNPNRTASINSRQNGYDISADALGYPELYYSPPAQALARIELIRGAASLQYGTQFGGALNFILKSGEDATKPFHFSTENSVGSFGFFSSFNQISGKKETSKGVFSYYGYYQYKQGKGWRDFSDFGAHTAYGNIAYKSRGGKFSAQLQQTAMHYLAQQAGGLTDNEFALTPRLAKRARNWFKVDWYISALLLQYKISPRITLDTRLFYVHAARASLGNLQPINRPDYGAPRDYILGQYRNLGNETRLLYRYNIAGRNAVLLAGARTYFGNTTQKQGYSNADSSGTKADFQFMNTDGILRNDYHFPSFNAAVFVENYTPIGKKWSVTPGIRVERISTNADGYYQNLVLAPSANGGDTLRNEAVFEQRKLSRHIFLAGIGTSHKPRENAEFYANISQNYRAINFNDMRVSNPNQTIDSLLRDESGFNADFGFRGKTSNGRFSWDASLFYLYYADRIGNLPLRRANAENPAITELYTLRTNIGNARVLGLEMLLQTDIVAWFQPQNAVNKSDFKSNFKSNFKADIYLNFSHLDGRYLNTENAATANKKLEFVPPMSLRTGLHLGYKSLDFSFQIAYTDSHFTDATNAERSPTATVGRVPNFTIADASMSYNWRFLRLQIGSNNLFNAMYFTRRALSYPGPGIIPADGRSFFAALRLSF
jgi:Fe(3+) dicitrate transport protein